MFVGSYLTHGLWSGLRTLGFIKLARQEQSKMAAVALGVLITLEIVQYHWLFFLGIIE